MRRHVRIAFAFLIVLALLSAVNTAKKSARKQRQQQNEVLKARMNGNNNSNNKCKTVRKSCQPRNTYVEIQGDDLSKFVYQVVQVKRCSGVCIGYKRCLPTKIVNTTLSIKGKGKCQKVTVEEHLGCKCDCRIKQKDCPLPRYYAKDRCACTCSPDFVNKCNRDKNKTANIENCTCECNNKRDCTTGTRWSPEECRCKLLQ